MTESAFDRLVSGLKGRGFQTISTGRSQARATCPAHDDRSPSLSVRAIEGQALLYCHAGCDTAEVLAALGLGMADLYDDRRGATYRYDSGRVVHRSPNKSFRQFGNTKAKPQLFRLETLRAKASSGRQVYLVEGEKDVLALESLGALATTAPMGAGNFAKVDVSPLHGATITAVVDKDDAGTGWAAAVSKCLGDKVESLSFVEAMAGKDAADHIAAGHGLSDFVPLPYPAEAEAYTLVRLADVTPQRVEWLWPGRLPAGKLVVLDGDPSLGKSTLSLDWAARVSTGTAWPDAHPCPTGGVLLMSAEDGMADTIRPRLDAAGADLSRLFAFTEVTETVGEETLTRPPSIPADIPRIESIVVQHGIRLVIVDVLMAYLGGNVQANRDQDVRRALHALAAVADRTAACILVIRHLNKSGGGNALYRGGGSIGIIGAARAGLLVAGDPDDETGSRRVLACLKSNLATKPASLVYQLTSTGDVARVEWLGEHASSADELLADHGDSEERTERDEATEWLLSFLVDNGGEAARKDIFKAGRAAGYSEATLKRAKTKAKVSHASAGFPRTTVWAYPVDSTQPWIAPTEPTAPTGDDQPKRATAAAKPGQSAQPLAGEPTAPTVPSAEPQCSECGDPEWVCGGRQHHHAQAVMV